MDYHTTYSVQIRGSMFLVIVERDRDMNFVASVPHMPGCHTQSTTLDELRVRISEAIELSIEVSSD